MSKWDNTTMTQQGQNLLDFLIAGTKKVNITRAVVGAGTVNATQLAIQTIISEPMQEMSMGNVSVANNAVTMPVILTNIDLETSYTARQIGVFAQAEGESEILFFIAQADANGQYIPSKYETPYGFTAEFNFVIDVGTASELNITVNSAGLLTNALAKELYASKEDTNAHISSKDNPHGVTAEQIGALTEVKAKELFGAGVEPVEWGKGVNINDLGPGYFYLDAKLEDGDWETMGLPEKYGAGWQGVYLVIKGNAGYGYEAYMRDWYDDTLWYTFLEGWDDTIWTQIFTSEGGTLDGDLSIKKSYPRLELENTDNGRSLAFLESDSYAQIANYKNSTNYRGIRIKPETAELESSVGIHEIVDGEVNDYNLYGEHNITKGTTDIGAGSALATGSIYLMHE